jgi:hypothetical protein
MTKTSTWKVRAKQCATCPFRTNKDPQLVARIQKQCLTEASQICHHPALHDEKEFELCRGARNFQLEIFHRLGVIKAPTDEAWQETREKYGC